MCTPVTDDLWRFQIGGVDFGDDTVIPHLEFTVSEPAAAVADQVMPGEDGMSMGRDYLQGRTLSWDLAVSCDTAADARAAWRSLEGAWDAAAVRSMPGAVTTVQIQAPYGDPVLAYGRPRKFAASETVHLRNGRVLLVADFATADRAFYAAAEQEVSFGIQPTIGIGGGISWPVTWPITWAPTDAPPAQVVTNSGDAPTWPVITFEGPVVDPKAVFGDGDVWVQVVGTLLANQSATVDTRPWARTVTRDDGGSMAGTLRGSRLAELALPPGSTTVAVQGIDLDGTASARIRWRDAYTTY